ncbi:oligopeptidase A [Paraferrimonas sedimenticola]|uniref:oligopeptidase A n=1 Tax=Paraferrimonas sedimenticola TaxID=375674 RepID=A0AA37RTL3_9GAMM|nr:oligopeptidase A [Paraferrimonas sedimenticola]GLP95401.1 oligopeptidase A [Paraferrimonas sedimenticola]
MANPLSESHLLPPFSAIQANQVQPAIEQAIAEGKAAIEQVLTQASPSWQNLVAPLELVDDKLSQAWSPVSHMNSVVNSDDLREAHDACLPMLSEYATFVGQHKPLYQAYKQIKADSSFESLTTAQKKVIDNALRDFELSGIGLNAEQQKRYGEIVSRLSELSSQFSNQVLDATQAYTVQLEDDSRLQGLPESAIAAAAAQAQARELEGYLLTLEFPSYLPVMMYADDASLREQMYRAFVTRASDQGPNAGEFDNSAIIDETLALRHELAQLLGFESYAHKSLATKMAQTPEQVLEFLNELAQKSKAQAQREVDELAAFAKAHHGVEKLNAWDYAYYGEKLKQHEYEISQEALRPYFPEAKVVSGLFEVVSRLFGIAIKAREGVDTWHQDVTFYDIFDASGELKGSFYLDLYARQNKRGGAWMDVCRERLRSENGLQKPVAYLTCNFNGPVDGKPALFTHDEVTTLFHEFGHGIHHMLSEIDTSGVSGINGVAWDAVELPSQFLENWCFEEEALAFISGHYETGESLPKAMLDKMLAAKNFQSGMMMLRQLEFALFDFRLHHEYDPKVGAEVQKVLNQVRAEVSVIPAPEFNRFQHSFSHIFAGGYAAGYYSYKWAEVLSADAFARFEEEGIFNPQTGRDFLTNILQAGGSKEAMDLFVGFRGREPSIEPLLRHSGIR